MRKNRSLTFGIASKDFCVYNTAKSPVDIVHRDGELDIIRIHVNTDACNDTKNEATPTAFIDSAVKSLMDLIFFPSNIRLPEGKLPPWFHLHFILMDQDLRELHVSPKQLQTKLVTVLSNSVQEKIQPLIHQLSSVAGLTQLSMDVTTESFVPIDNIRTFLTEERFLHRRNSRLLPYLATLHGVPEPHYLQYILYIASGENQLASITTTCNNDTGKVSRAVSLEENEYYQQLKRENHPAKMLAVAENWLRTEMKEKHEVHIHEEALGELAHAMDPRDRQGGYASGRGLAITLTM
eukprot:CAMPEP_0172435512 /NCGR_PEP_ID=MMETSP1064-20121228/71220_1 /TAXON_ID=202472 /ORGANISM="Aulacoseira subarctica , Strain CCAP 1002/5" /LENGTH=293 /DNA_ID=CAMNT_0013183833 /DNA_START=336 /DNA_END=1215 /DNA_ORIENTATION=-